MDATEAATALNTAKTGITAGQASAIAANTSAVALRALIADPVFTGNMEITNSSSDCIISLQRTGHATHYLKSHSEDYLGFGVDGGSNNGLKMKLHDDVSNGVEIYGNLNIPSGSTYKIDGTALSKSDVGLGNCDNTSDADKPVSSATTTALALKSNIASPTFTTKIVTPMVEAASNLELKATGSNAVKMFTNGSERCKVTSAGNLLFNTGLGLNLSKPTQTAIEWDAHQALIEVTINTVRSASIPIYSSFNMSGVQRFFLEVTSDQISEGSVIVAHSYSPNGYTDWLPEVSKLRSMYVSGSAGKFRVTGAVSGTHSMNGNSTTNLYVNYTIM